MSAALSSARCSRSDRSCSSPCPSCASRRRPTTACSSRTPRSSGALRGAEERDRALAALKELEFDHRTGKVSDEDYREQVGRPAAACRRDPARRWLAARTAGRSSRRRAATARNADSRPERAGRRCSSYRLTRPGRCRSSTRRRNGATTASRRRAWCWCSQPRGMILAIVLLATGHWPLGLIVLGVTVLLVLVTVETRRSPGSRGRRPRTPSPPAAGLRGGCSGTVRELRRLARCAGTAPVRARRCGIPWRRASDRSRPRTGSPSWTRLAAAEGGRDAGSDRADTGQAPPPQAGGAADAR